VPAALRGKLKPGQRIRSQKKKEKDQEEAREGGLG